MQGDEKRGLRVPVGEMKRDVVRLQHFFLSRTGPGQRRRYRTGDGGRKPVASQNLRPCSHQFGEYFLNLFANGISHSFVDVSYFTNSAVKYGAIAIHPKAKAGPRLLAIPPVPNQPALPLAALSSRQIRQRPRSVSDPGSTT